MREITLTIDGIKCVGQEGQTILEVAAAAGIHIPVFCLQRPLAHALRQSRKLCHRCRPTAPSALPPPPSAARCGSRRFQHPAKPVSRTPLLLPLRAP